MKQSEPIRSVSGQSYRQILTSTAVIAGSSIINIVFSIVRTKVVAVLLGPSGVGVMGLFSSIADLMQSITTMGIHSSGVRQVAEAAGSGDTDRIARTAIVLRRTSIFLAFAGALLLVMFAAPISTMTFGNPHQAAGVALLAAALFFRVISGSQMALLQGLRRISDLARMSILAAMLGTGFTVALIFILGEGGIVLSLVAMAAASLLLSWHYSRKLRILRLPLTSSQVGREAAALLTLGLGFLASGFLTMGAAYGIRILVLRSGGVEAAGMYQAAWTIGGLYAGFVLQAMGTDFYPRLTAVCRDDSECNRLVNEQTQISLLLAGPGVIATLTLAPLVLRVFFSADFQSAVGMLRWVCLGMVLRIAAWPMGFIVLAKNAQRIFVGTEVAAALVHVGLAWQLVERFGVDGAGAAFFGLYVWHSVLIYVIVRRLSGFRWSAANLKLGLLLLSGTAVVFCSLQFLPTALSSIIGGVAMAISGAYSIRTVLRLLPVESLPRPLRPWLASRVA